jgi:YD repeat-containing protein
VTYPDGRQVAYGYDDVGNRTAETERDAAGVVVSQKVAVFDAANRLRHGHGRRESFERRDFFYDAKREPADEDERVRSRQLHVRHARPSRGDGLRARRSRRASRTTRSGRRYLKIGAEGLRQYLYDQTSLIEEFSDANVEVAKYEWDAERLKQPVPPGGSRGGTSTSTLSGSVAALTDSSGGVTAPLPLRTPGVRLSAMRPSSTRARNRFGFTGHYFDTETKLYYAKARYFDPDFVGS